MVEGPRPFAHLNGTNAGLYRAVMGMFVQAKRRFAVHLRPEDVHEALIRRSGSAPELAAVGEVLATRKVFADSILMRFGLMPKIPVAT